MTDAVLLEAGPALDAEVARQVFDQYVYERWEDAPDGWQPVDARQQLPVYADGTFLFSVPRYSTDLDATQAVIEWLRE